MIKIDYISLIKRILVVIGANFLMFVLLLMSEGGMIFVFDQQLPYEVMYVTTIIGVIGSILFLINKTPFRYLVLWPPILLGIIFMTRPPMP